MKTVKPEGVVMSPARRRLHVLHVSLSRFLSHYVDTAIVRYVVETDDGDVDMGAVELDVSPPDWTATIARFTRGPVLPQSLHSEIEDAARSACLQFKAGGHVDLARYNGDLADAYIAHAARANPQHNPQPTRNARTVKPDNRPAFQGDIMIRRVDELPDGLKKSAGTEHVVAHSETGHHHVALGGTYYTSGDPFVAYLVTTEPTRVEHRRSTDTHETLELLVDGPEVVWEIRRQREHTPEGWRRVED